MFSLKNVYNRDSMAIAVKHNDKELDFIIKSIVNKRNRDELQADRNSELLNEFIKYKGAGFADQVYILLEEIFDQLENDAISSGNSKLPKEPIHRLLDMFPLEEVYDFLKNNYRLQAPSILKDEFDVKTEENRLWTRVQTYLKSDYIELAALSVIMKVVLGPIAHYAYINADKLGRKHKEYILFNVIRSHPVYETAPMQKLYGLIEKTISSNVNKADNSEVSDIRIIEKQIPKEDLPIWLLSIAVLQKLAIAPIIGDEDNKNIITRIYTFISNKLSVRADIANTIRAKRPMLDTNTGDEESAIESYRF